ncbi:MAG: tetratricopeptide repeat protein, partial [Chitinophagales bacterium]|nr:tetratricopeptide repeat protein [Chitinophagales bacterium]
SISVECMNCHNMYPAFDTTSLNKFLTVKTGIECERCHGAGGEHVKEKLAGIYVDTLKEIDYSIVNPANLSRDLQVELCQRCHMQGISILNEGKTFFDFKPGMKLNEVMNVFMPRYENDPPIFIMASHADRMKQSKCYLKSEMTCLTCHNPHVSVKFTSEDQFNSACKNCHTSPKVECKLSIAERQINNDNCSQCHMPVSETIDIPNVTVHDHRIQIPVTRNDKDAILKFVRLECMTTKNPDDLLMAKGYLQTFEGFSAQPFLLDSAKKYLDHIEERHSHDFVKTNIRYFFLSNNYNEVIQLTNEKIKIETETDAWTLYRIGESYYQTNDFVSAEKYFSKAVSFQKNNLEFLNKKGSVLMVMNKIDDAQKTFQYCFDLNPKFAPAVSNLGYTYFVKADFVYAEKLFDQALALDPDYEQALMNKVALFVVQRKNDEAKKYLQRVIKLNPQNEKAKAAMLQLAI